MATAVAEKSVDDLALAEAPRPGTAPSSIDTGRPRRYWARRDEYRWLAACFLAMIVAGWNDAQTGPLLLRIQANYRLTYTVVSLIFVFGFLGFLTAALCNVWLTDRLGFGKVIVGGASCQIIAYAIQSGAPPFPAFCLSFFINGIGMGIQDAQANTLVANLDLVDGRTTRMSCLHAFYGVGALCSPLVATQFAEMRRWNFHYLTSLGIAVINVVFLCVVFRFRHEDTLLCKHIAQQEARGTASPIADQGKTEVDGHTPSSGQVAMAADGSQGVEATDPVAKSSGLKLRTILLSPLVQLLAWFCLLYVSAEITIGSWIVPYVQTTLNGPPNTGMISSGYFAGLTIGRIIFIPVNGWLGERKAIYVYTVVAVALEIVIWRVPSIIGTGVAVSFVGMFLGPIYPLIMHQCTHALPEELYSGAIGYIASLGQAGSAIFPFATGAAAQQHGVWVLQPLVIGILVAELSLWAAAMWVSRHR